MHYAKVFVGAVLVLALTACSTQIGYRFADTLIEWELNEFVEFSDSQQQQVDLAITELHHWHATQELPIYAQELQLIRDKIVNQTLSEADILNVYERALSAWHRSLSNIQPYAMTMMPTLTDAQVAQIEAALAERLADEREELAELGTPQKRQERLRKRAKDNAQNWLHRPSSVQRRLINDWTEQRLSTRELWLEYTESWNKAFIEALRMRRDINQFPKRIEQLFYHSDQLYSEELRQRIAHNRELTMTLMVNLYQSLDAKQRQRIANKLDDYIEDFNELAMLFEENGLN